MWLAPESGTRQHAPILATHTRTQKTKNNKKTQTQKHGKKTAKKQRGGCFLVGPKGCASRGPAGLCVHKSWTQAPQNGCPSACQFLRPSAAHPSSPAGLPARCPGHSDMPHCQAPGTAPTWQAVWCLGPLGPNPRARPVQKTKKTYQKNKGAKTW